MANDIKLIKMTSGEHVLAKIIAENEHTIRLKRPALVFMQEIPGPGGQNKVEVHLSPFAPFSQKDEIDIERGAIQYISWANSNIVTQYTKATTGIEIPESPGLILS